MVWPEKKSVLQAMMICLSQAGILMEGLGSSWGHGFLLLEAILGFSHPLVQRRGWSLLYAGILQFSRVLNTT